MEQLEEKINFEGVEEFITKSRERKKPYELSTKPDGTKIITIDRSRKISPADKEYIEMLIKADYIPVDKRKDITKADMLKYVKNNYDKKEFDLLNKKIDEINSEDPITSKKITFTTVKSWFTHRYIFYPKGLDWNFGTSTTAKEKKERFIEVFKKHQEELKKERGNAEGEPKESIAKSAEDKEQGKNDNDRNKNRHHN